MEEVMTGEIKDDVRTTEPSIKKKRKILFATDSALTRSGFGRSAKCLIEYLYKTNKYEIVHFCMGTMAGDPNNDRTPWKCIGAVDPILINQLKQQNPQHHEQIDRQAGYGYHTLEKTIKEEKPIASFLIQDPWAFSDIENRDWFNKTTIVFNPTIDSRPILPSVITTCSKSKHYWPWAEFATKDLHKSGLTHARTVRGALETKYFYKLPNSKKEELRKSFNISSKTFVIGFVFRNQLRKTVEALICAFKMLKKDIPDSKILLFTSFQEGWNIPAFVEEHKLDPNDILTAYVCKNCNGYEVKPFTGLDLDCKFCGAQKSQITTHPSLGIDEAKLNEVYNLMDVYSHQFSSGGQELPIQEAKLTELITLVTNYSCGEDNCVAEACSLPLEYAEYREPGGTQFIKASTYPSSIAKQLKKVYEMPLEKRIEMGKRARQWVLDNFSVEKIGKIYEEFIDSLPENDYNFEEKYIEKDPNFIPPENIENDQEFITMLYQKILKRSPDEEGFRYWSSELAKVN